ncbi:alcohol dehydrogenase catalytic domain-containing protein [Rhodopirellula sallentina]|uniref:Alcohol dehydrogenase zinc-binding domain-containing protein n=1 Tax=Rhodopirellula sallentina SM41 TaxID=1263870 RepID=M5U2Z9_9BACT|nr:alcohol dehydrogenase catalytic domain-containing protein [Rhodopirellula sallentina]EMI52216.1 alcohol dehydrogenase zinc-binding domain-containing protein [Rhodopirellula sallentina SM41]
MRSPTIVTSNHTTVKTMKAIYHEEYGSFDDLRLTDIEAPIPRDNEVLVRVHAAGLHVGDCFGVRGSPLLMRVESGWWKPKYGVPGYDVAGTVEAIGCNVRSLQRGDEVFGYCSGSCAEFTVADEKTLSKKPTSALFRTRHRFPRRASRRCMRCETSPRSNPANTC